MEIRKKLSEFSQAFETFTRGEDPEHHWRLKSKEKDIYHNLVREIHSVEMLPDDYRFSIISKISDELVHNLPWSEIETVTEFEEKAEELRHECVDGLVDISVHGLLRWASSHSQRVQMVDEASEIYGRPDSLVRQLRVVQYHEIDEIYARFIKYFAEFCEE